MQMCVCRGWGGWEGCWDEDNIGILNYSGFISHGKILFAFWRERESFILPIIISIRTE